MHIERPSHQNTKQHYARKLYVAAGIVIAVVLFIGYCYLRYEPPTPASADQAVLMERWSAKVVIGGIAHKTDCPLIVDRTGQIVTDTAGLRECDLCLAQEKKGKEIQ